MKKKLLLPIFSLFILQQLFAQNVGIGTTSPIPGALLHVELGASTTKGSLVTGTYNPTSTVPDLGAGSRFMFYPGKVAFRAGYTNATQWDNSNVGQFSTAMGYGTTASGYVSTALGRFTLANNSYATASGYGSTASGAISSALGAFTTASGGSSTAMGRGTIASGDSSTAMGVNTTAGGSMSLATGYGSSASGYTSSGFGYGSVASGSVSAAFGLYTTASGDFSMATGQNSMASGVASTAMGKGTIASGDSSTAIGCNSEALGTNSVAMGYLSVASGLGAVAIGNLASAEGSYSTALGVGTHSYGLFSTAMGHYTESFGESSTSLGSSTVAKGRGSLVSGGASSVGGSYSTGLGNGIIVKGYSSTVVGMYNDSLLLSDQPTPFYLTPTTPLFTVGNGNFQDRSNAMVVLKNGNVGIGNNIPTNPLSFPPVLGKKISLYPGGTGDAGFAVQGNQLLIYSDNPSASVRLGYDQSGTFTNNLDVYGNGNAWLRGTLTQNSDMRLKKDVSHIANALPLVMQLSGYHYHWKNENMDTALQSGVLAQEVQKVFPQLVKEDAEGTLSVNYTGFIPYIIEAFKDQQKQVEELKIQNKMLLGLEAKMKALENIIAQMNNLPAAKY